MDDQAAAVGTQALAIKTALAGGTVAQSSFVSDWEPYCDNPVTVDRRITSRLTNDGIKFGGLKLLDPLKSLEVSIQVPCRRCDKCLQFRQMQWRERALIEIEKANRTWWVTLTLSPTHLAGILLEARSDSDKHVEAAAYNHVQRYFKRLRKLGAEFRYLAVFERGRKTGRQHYHLFLHETGTRPVVKLLIEAQWRSNVHARLVGGMEARGRATYITKYATKSFAIRPRASLDYGKNPLLLKTESFKEKITLIWGKKRTTPKSLIGPPEGGAVADPQDPTGHDFGILL